MNRQWRFWVYIMASRSRRIYTGVTNDIERRVQEHKSGEVEGFTQKYKINRLVYRERFHYIDNAIAREKEIKGWDRARRVALIESETRLGRICHWNGECPSKRWILPLRANSRSLASLVMTTPIDRTKLPSSTNS